PAVAVAEANWVSSGRDIRFPPLRVQGRRVLLQCVFPHKDSAVSADRDARRNLPPGVYQFPRFRLRLPPITAAKIRRLVIAGAVAGRALRGQGNRLYSGARGHALQLANAADALMAPGELPGFYVFRRYQQSKQSIL